MAVDLETLLHYLQSANLAERQAAAIELSHIKDERLLEPLLQALRDEDATVRANAAAGLGLNQAQSALDALITALQDKDEIVRERAATALAQIGDKRAIDALIDALDTSSAWTKNRIIYVLGASKDARAIEPLLEQLNSPNASTRGVAAWALSALGAVSALEPLTELLNDSDASVRANAVWGLGELGQAESINALVPLLGDTSAEVRGKTAWALGTLGETTGQASMVDGLIALLDDYAEIPNSSAHVFVCQYAAEALTQIGTDQALQAVEAWKPVAREKLLPRRLADLIRALQHKDLETRERAIAQLTELGSASVAALIKALQTHENPRVRQGAAQTLGILEDGQALHPLLMALDDSDIGVWSQATAALARLGKKGEKALRTALASQKLRVKQGAALALWRSQREERAFTILLQALQDDELVIRGSAITSLWLQADERAVATLQIQLQKEEGMMAQYILQALQTIGTPMAVATIRHWQATQGGT